MLDGVWNTPLRTYRINILALLHLPFWVFLMERDKLLLLSEILKILVINAYGCIQTVCKLIALSKIWASIMHNPLYLLGLMYEHSNGNLSKINIYNSKTTLNLHLFWQSWTGFHWRLLPILNSFDLSSIFESIHRKYSTKKLFLEISQYSQEITCIRVSF